MCRPAQMLIWLRRWRKFRHLSRTERFEVAATHTGPGSARVTSRLAVFGSGTDIVKTVFSTASACHPVPTDSLLVLPDGILRLWGSIESMGITTEILSLRRNQTSSVSLLIGAIEWQHAAKSDSAKLMRSHAVLQAADLVLLNTAVHAQETMDEPRNRGSRRAATPSRRRRRRSDPSTLLRQHRLFA